MVKLLFHLVDVAIQDRYVITFLIQLFFQLRATLFQLLQASFSCSIAAPQHAHQALEQHRTPPIRWLLPRPRVFSGLHTNGIGPMLGIEPGVLRELINQGLDDLEDAYLGAAALEAHRRSREASIPLAALMEDLGLED